MEKSERHQSGGHGQGFLMGLLLGGIIGGLVALLMAPKPGPETRARLREKSAGVRGRAEELASQARTRMRSAAEEARHVASRLRAGHHKPSAVATAEDGSSPEA